MTVSDSRKKEEMLTIREESYASSVMMAKNSCSLISPSWSRSNSSIIACLRNGRTRGEQIWNSTNGKKTATWQTAVKKKRKYKERELMQ